MKSPDFRIGDKIDNAVLKVERAGGPDDIEVIIREMSFDESGVSPPHPEDRVSPVRRVEGDVERRSRKGYRRKYHDYDRAEPVPDSAPGGESSSQERERLGGKKAVSRDEEHKVPGGGFIREDHEEHLGDESADEERQEEEIQFFLPVDQAPDQAQQDEREDQRVDERQFTGEEKFMVGAEKEVLEGFAEVDGEISPGPVKINPIHGNRIRSRPLPDKVPALFTGSQEPARRSQRRSAGDDGQDQEE